MLLKSLELQGFKTFPDKTVLTFERGITSVVGPNGSGKSNISDAVRWVLGEQSVRSLRCSKMEDVIFGGTPQRKAMGYAEVTLNIDNSDRRLPFENDSVSVTRRYYRSGDSEYLINKNTVRLKDINELFMDTGLGRDGYSIIGQGRIESIVSAKSEDRREIFEEAAGISRYRYRKEESERRLNKAEENLIRLRDILSELEGRVGPLKEQAEKAQKFIEYDDERKSLEIGVWLATLERSDRLLREQSEKTELMNARYAEIEEELKSIAQRIEENFRETGECTSQMESLRNEAAALDEQAVRAEGEIDLINNEISHIQQDIKRIENDIALAVKSRDDADREIEEKNAQISEKNTQIDESREKLLSFTSKLEELRKTADEATRKIEETAVKNAELSASLSEERIKLSSAESSAGEISLRSGQLEERIAATGARLNELTAEKSELESMLKAIAEEISAHENAVKGYSMRADSRAKKLESAREELNKLTLDVNEQLRRARLLEDLERNLEGFAQSVKAVMKEASRGSLSGVCGPVSRIVKAPREYAVAIETALGAAMQNVIVETEQDAKNAIRLLKQRELGRATFLPVTTIRGNVLDEAAVRDMPGFVGVASGLVTCDAKYFGIRNSLLGRVVIAEDLDSAVSIAKKSSYRFRVVSLDGQVVNAGGSLTGGSRAKSSGLLSRVSEIESIRQKAEELSRRRSAAEAKFKELKNELSTAQAELEAARGELAALNEDKLRTEGECARNKRELEAAANESLELNNEKNTARSRLESLTEIKNKAADEISRLEAEIRQSKEETDKITGSREEQLLRVEDISGTIQELRMREFSAQKDRDALIQTVNELKNRQHGLLGEADKLKEEKLALNAKTEELKSSAEASGKKAEDFRRQAEDKRGGINLIAEKRSSLEKEAGELRAKERESSLERENVSHETARLQEKSDNLQKEYDSIISRLWEDYELTRREAEETGARADDLPATQKRLSELKNKIKALGAVNVGAVVEYKEVSQRYEFLKAQTDDAEKSKKELLSLIDNLTKRMREQFVERFALINKSFSTIFRELFGGGAAELSFTDASDALSSGIEIKVQPPGKIVSHIESLSGGEKTLVAISIYFAIMRVNPPPFCVLDEIDAALDDVNVVRYAQYLRRMSGNTQFISITHRRGTMEGSDVLYGVTMQDEGVSKLLKIKTEETAEFSNSVN